MVPARVPGGHREDGIRVGAARLRDPGQGVELGQHPDHGRPLAPRGHESGGHPRHAGLDLESGARQLLLEQRRALGLLVADLGQVPDLLRHGGVVGRVGLDVGEYGVVAGLGGCGGGGGPGGEGSEGEPGGDHARRFDDAVCEGLHQSGLRVVRMNGSEQITKCLPKIASASASPPSSRAAFPSTPPRRFSELCATTAAAADAGAGLVVFPEAFVGGYPWGLAFGTSVGGRKPAGRRTFGRYHDAAIRVPGPETERMGRAAADAGVYLAVGVIEKGATHSPGTLFCTLLYFAPDGTLAGLHRKLKPTAAERLIWGEGDGSTLPVLDTPFGKVGGLICWENYMPLARMAMYGKGVEIYLAPTADSRDRWQATLRHIALEGRCFVIGCNQFVTKEH